MKAPASKIGAPLLVIAAVCGALNAQTPVGTAFAYQGQLKLAGEPLDVAGRGCLGLEEKVVVTEGGCEFLSSPQVTLRLLG